MCLDDLWAEQLISEALYLISVFTHFFASFSGDLKNLLQVQPACPDLCCHILKQHPQHAKTFAKYLKKHRTPLPAHAPTLALLLEQEEIASVAQAALVKVMDEIKAWAVDTNGAEDATRVLLPYTLKLNLMGKTPEVAQQSPWLLRNHDLAGIFFVFSPFTVRKLSSNVSELHGTVSVLFHLSVQDLFFSTLLLSLFFFYICQLCTSSPLLLHLVLNHFHCCLYQCCLAEV